MITCYEPRTIAERLDVLYSPTESKLADAGIRKLIETYQKKIKSQNYHLSEKDTILITYADQVQSPPHPPLETLLDFLEKQTDGMINSVHILPFYPFSSDDGFSVVDYKEVDPHFGSWKEIEAFKQHFRLMFDGVINHVSQFSDWFKAYLANDPDFTDFFIDVDPVTDLSDVVRPRATPLLHEFTDANGRIHNIWTTFSKDQVDLNYANHKVLLAVLDALFFYIEKGARLLRLDAIAFVWKEIGTPSAHLPQTHELIQLIRDALHQAAPEVIIITETNVPHHENISYFGSGDDEAQMVYNFALPPLLLHSVLTGGTDTLIKWAQTLELPSDKVCFFNFTASHDGVGLRPVNSILDEDEIARLEEAAKRSDGLVSYRSNPDGTDSPYELNCSYIDLLSTPEADNTTRIKRMMLTQAIMLAMPGVPGIYFHSLVGSRNYLRGVKMTGINRSINREKFNAHGLETRLKQEGSLERSIFKSYKRLLSVRIHESAFDPFGEFFFTQPHPALFCIHRENRDDGSQLMAIHNFSDEDVIFVLHNYLIMPATELISGSVIERPEVKIEAYGVMWLKSGIAAERLAESNKNSTKDNL